MVGSAVTNRKNGTKIAMAWRSKCFPLASKGNARGMVIWDHLGVQGGKSPRSSSCCPSTCGFHFSTLNGCWGLSHCLFTSQAAGGSSGEGMGMDACLLACKGFCLTICSIMPTCYWWKCPCTQLQGDMWSSISGEHGQLNTRVLLRKQEESVLGDSLPSLGQDRVSQKAPRLG